MVMVSEDVPLKVAESRYREAKWMINKKACTSTRLP